MTHYLVGKRAERNASSYVERPLTVLHTVSSVLLAATLFALGCSDEQATSQGGVSAADVKSETAQALDTAGNFAQQQKEEFLRATAQEMDRLKTDLDELGRESQSASDETREKLAQQVHALEEKWNAADAKMAALRSQTGEGFDALKQELVAAVTDLRESYQEVRRSLSQG